MLESERYNTESDNEGSASDSRSPDVTGADVTGAPAAAAAGHGADVPAGEAQDGQEGAGPGRRLLRRARKAVVRPAGPPGGDAASPDAGEVRASGAEAGQQAQPGAGAAEQPAPQAAGAPARRRRAASRPAADQPEGAQPAAAQPAPAQPAAAAQPAAGSGPAGGRSAAVPAPEFTVSAQTAPAAMFQPPVVIFQPPDLATGQAPARDAPGRGGRDAQEDGAGDPGGSARRRTRSGRGSGTSGGPADDGRPADGGNGARRSGEGADRADDETAAGAGPDGEADGGGPAGRRRRRGGRGHSKGRGGAEDGADGATSGEDDRDGRAAGAPRDPAEEDGPGGDGADGGPDTPARRRRRRRRSGSGGDTDVPSSDDPPNTVVHVRAPRTEAEEAAGDVRSIKGSTRLEAKRQRRREGRESGRRRPPIITESEFLARREAVDRVMVVRQTGDRTQIAVMEDGVLVEHYVDKASHQSYVGNVYLGKVQNVLPSMEAAFVDIGKGRNAVLYAGEVNFDASGLEGESKRIESALKSGQSILVQATKDPIGHKGARLTSQVSLPGRYLVYVPGASMTGISRKLPDTERTRLKQILKQVMPENAGVIVRTAAEGAAEEELARDVKRLAAQWEAIERKAKSATAPELLYSEPDLTIRVVRDIFNEDFTKLVIASDSEWDIVDEYIRYVAPHLADRLERWTEEHDVFAAYRIDEQIAKALERKVWLPSGGSLVIDTTEAMTVIDVNTGKFTGQGGNLEQTVTRNNLEAAEEIVRQLRVRDVGGIIVIDFIDMVLESNRDLVLRRMLECLARDRTKHQVAEVTSLGLVQMTRKRVGSGLLEAFSVPCEHCNGRGVLISHEPVDHAPAINQRGRSGDDRSGKDDRSADDRSKDDRPKDGRSGQDGRGRGRSRGGEARADEARTGDGDAGSATDTAGPAKRSRSASARAKAGQAKTDEARSDRDRGDQDRSDQDRADQEHAHQGEASRGGEQATGQQARPDGEQTTGGQASPDGEQPGGAQVSGTQADQRPSSGGRGRRRGPARREQAPPAAEHTGAADGPGSGQGQDAEPAAV